jgi:hypothetical protein
VNGCNAERSVTHLNLRTGISHVLEHFKNERITLTLKSGTRDDKIPDDLVLILIGETEDFYSLKSGVFRRNISKESFFSAREQSKLPIKFI